MTVDFQKIKKYLTDDIWRIRKSQLSGRHSMWINQLRIMMLAVRRFDENDCQLRASALTFYSLLSIVPVVAMAFGIAKGFGFEKLLETQLYEKLRGQEEAVRQILAFSNSLLQNTQGGVIAGVGVAILFYTVIKVLGNIENSFNIIWGVKKARSFSRKFSDYMSIMMICPILLIMSSSLTVFMTSQVTLIVAKLSFLGPVGEILLLCLKILPFCVMWAVFTFIYIFLPNTKVNFKAGLVGGIIGGTFYQLGQWIYIKFQVGVASYGAIYGSFAALPLFLIWLQTSWLIVLFGAELSFAEQNVDTYEFEPDSLKASRKFKQIVALGIAQVSIKRFYQAEVPLTANQIAQSLELPIRLANQVIFEMTEAGILAEVKFNEGKIVAYQPARDIHQLTIHQVLRLMEENGLSNIPYAETAEIKKIKESLESLSRKIQSAPENQLLKDI
ncbi:MAG: YihY family inner membrane protein [Candidatus Omnitrophica bacterium]|nr:YihY family inner membrane protein [Candidatus Omnitrophota bacterium]